MRFFLAAAVLCASTALAQFESDDYDDELQARDARNAVWRAAHGGKAPNYRGFEDMAQHYPGHPGKSFGMRHHARDVDDEDDIGDEEGFIDATSNFANNVARAVKGAYDHVGHKAEEAVKHAKAKAGHQDDWRQFQQGGQRGGRGPHGGSWNNPRDVDDEAEFDEDESSDIFARDVADDDDEFEYSQDIDWDPSTTGEDDEDAQLAERDVEDDADEPAATAFDDDDEELPDPKLQLEQEFDEGLVERDEDGEGIFERDAEAFNFYGRGKGRDHERPNHAEFEAWKKGMRHVFARDSGLDPEDEDLDGAYDPISDDPNLTDEEFYGDAEELEKRSALRTKDGITVDDDDEDDDDDDHTRRHKSKTNTKSNTKTKTKDDDKPTKSKDHDKPTKSKDHDKPTKSKDHDKPTKSKDHDKPDKTKEHEKPTKTKTWEHPQATRTQPPAWGGWFPWGH